MRLISFICAALIGAAFAGPSRAQQRPDIFANPENLKVLPKDISSADLRQTMRGFALGLGVRCTHCHDGEEGAPLSEVKFPSDKKITKRIARGMIEMVASINQRVDKITSEADHEQVEVRCVTCHRGHNRPLLLGDVIAPVVMEGGADAAVAKYRDLREKYYGGHTFDFGEFALSEVADKLLAQDQGDAAIALHKLNAEYYPDSAMVYVYLGGTYQRLEQTDLALENYRRALELNPNFGFVKQRIEALEKPAE